MFIIICVCIAFAVKSEASLKLIFNDEFDGSDSLDPSKWDVQHEEVKCNGNWINQLNCKTNNKTNLRVLNGTLSLAAIKHKYRNKYYTSPLITTKHSFTYGRVEMRAALPKGKMLRPILFLAPTTTSGRWPKDGEIDIMSNTQDQELKYGIHFIRDAVAEDIGKISLVSENLNQFQIYVLEWTESEISWIFNGKTLYSINITKELANNYNPFSKEFKLKISLGVGGYVGSNEFFVGQTLYEKDVEEWECSLLIFDYIRIYQNVSEEVINPVLPIENNVTSSDICLQIMPDIRPKRPNWRLIFSDEFDKTGTIDQDVWQVRHEDKYCDGNGNKQLNCNTNSTRNVRLSDGALVLAAIHEKYLKKEFTAPLITTKRSFKFAKFVIRAALPEGKLIRPFIYLEPTEGHNNSSNVVTKDGNIEFLSNTQTSDFNFGIRFAINNDAKYVGRVASKSLITDSLNTFHSYAMEWTETEIRWYFNDIHLFTASLLKELKDNYNPFDKPFRLVISLGVGGEEESDEWPCSLLIIDYIRVYEMSDKNVDPIVAQNKIQSSEICDKIMPLISKNKKKDSTSNLLIILISIPSVILVMAIIPLNIYLFIRYKKSRKNNELNND